MVMKLKNDVNTLPANEYVGVVKVGNSFIYFKIN